MKATHNEVGNMRLNARRVSAKIDCKFLPISLSREGGSPGESFLCAVAKYQTHDVGTVNICN